MIILFLITIAMGAFLGIRRNAKLLWKELYISKWNDPCARYLLCRANVDGDPSVNYGDSTISFQSKTEMVDIVNTNRTDYVGEFVYHYSCISYPARLFYTDNNYYALYYDKKNKCYRAENCYMRYWLDDKMISLPSPVYIDIDYASFRIYNDDNKNMLNFLYENYTFDQAKKFYERISEEFVKIDDKSKQIILDGYDLRENKIIERCITLDFKNRTIIALRANGDLTTLDGTEKRDPRPGYY